jgi:hypothetical protein
MFFFEKKNQKTFASLGAHWGKVRDSEQKFFASFFQKRSSFCLAHQCATAAAAASSIIWPSRKRSIV